MKLFQFKNFNFALLIFLIIAASAGIGYFVGYIVKSQLQLYQNLNTEDSSQSLQESTDELSEDGKSESFPAVVIDDIEWQSPEPVTDLNYIFNLSNTASRALSLDSASYLPETVKIYLVGKVKSGEFNDYNLILASAGSEGIHFGPSFFRFIQSPDGNLILLTRYSDEFFGNSVAQSEAISISSLELPDTLSGPESRQILIRDQYQNVFFDYNNISLAFNHPTYGNVYTTARPTDSPRNIFEKNGFYIRLPDSTTAVYSWNNDLVDNDNLMRINWRNGRTELVNYNFAKIGGCGRSNYQDVIWEPDFTPSYELKAIGLAETGDIIYTYESSDDVNLKYYYDNEYFAPTEDKLNYNEFVNINPIVFFRDPFGRLTRGTSAQIASIAECGKPVIYLYPETPTQVEVKLNPQGGFSKTEPEYNNGWRLTAFPDGTLTNKDGKTYPYLFWEGRGGLYETPERGFVVAEKDVHKFLVEKLSLLGLNQKETEDFLEFWEPRMTGNPYYFVTFLGNAAMNQLAPLEISPQPDSVIRILMDFRPLEKPISVEPIRIRTPERKGFTVIEWGGVLR